MPRRHCIEEWRTIPSYPLYQASNFGRIRRVVPPSSKKWGKALRPRENNCGYLYVHISRGQKADSKYVHHLIAEAFLGPKPEGKIIDHDDGNKQNNCWWNLYYVTPEENLERAYALGLAHAIHGEAHAFSRLTEQDVTVIRQRLQAGETDAALAREFGVARSAIYLIRERKTWKHVA